MQKWIFIEWYAPVAEDTAAEKKTDPISFHLEIVVWGARRKQTTAAQKRDSGGYSVVSSE